MDAATSMMSSSNHLKLLTKLTQNQRTQIPHINLTFIRPLLLLLTNELSFKMSFGQDRTMNKLLKKIQIMLIYQQIIKTNY